MNPRIACIQLRAGSSPDDNLAAAERFIRQAAASGADIALLPERWEAFGSADEIRAAAQPLDGPRLTAVQGWARELGMAIVAGSVAERVAGDERLRNTSVAFDRDGRQVAVYRKIHQFDVDLPGQRVRESDTDAPGTGGVIATLGDVRVGLTICYDLRFPELYRAYAVAGATVLTVPAAFLERTGRDHWEVLLRARAIENQCFVVAANQYGALPAGLTAYGRSMIIDPWGTVLAQAPDGQGVIVADCDHDGSRACARRCRRSPTAGRRRTTSRADLRVAAVALAVGLVLADASVVILALPAIYREYHAEVADVAWVVTAFNLAIALAAVPAARLATRRPAGQVCAGGLVLFAAASAACALAPSLAFLIAARAVQGVGGAAAVCAALELLPALAGGERRAVRVWAAAGVAGAALGPAIGGLLTQLISWQSIFVAQMPLALIPALVVFRRGAPVVARARACRTSPPTSRSGCSRRASPPCSSCSCCCSSRAGACRRSPRRSPSRRCRSRRSSRDRSSGAWRARARARRPARCSAPAASRGSGCCRARAGRGRSRRSCSSARGSRSRSAR